MKTKKGEKILELKKLIKKNVIEIRKTKAKLKAAYRKRGSIEEKIKLRDILHNSAYEIRHLYIVYGQLRGVSRNVIEKRHRLAKPLQEGFISQLMAKYSIKK